jgi:hypothetical protein
MTAITFDTLKLAQRLEKAGFDRKQAEAQAEALAEAMDTGIDSLATKTDIQKIRQDMETMKTDIIKWSTATLLAATGIFALIVKLMS